ncbi:MAG: cysteine rich repeat-containing protein [Gallionella sp.]
MKYQTVYNGVQTKRVAVLAGVLCLAIATGASAQQNAKPCAEDAARLCVGIQPGGGRLARCLKEHAAELSPACKKSIAKAKRKAAKWKQACKQDAQTLCEGVKAGGGRIVQCLKQHQDELTMECREAMAKPKGGV